MQIWQIFLLIHTGKKYIYVPSPQKKICTNLSNFSALCSSWTSKVGNAFRNCLRRHWNAPDLRGAPWRVKVTKSIIPMWSSIGIAKLRLTLPWYSWCRDHHRPLFRNKRFALNEMFQQNASKFAIFYVYENPCSFFRFSFHATLSFYLMKALVYVGHS